MKRAPFLGSAAALVLSACSGRTLSRALPPGLPGSSSSRSAAAATKAVYDMPADPIPTSVLTNPIVGEAWRFDGTVAPAKWKLMDGSSLSCAEYFGLFQVLRYVAGGAGTRSFMLPKPQQGWIIAVDGIFPSTPQTIAASARANTIQNSLGPGARVVIARPVSPKQQEKNMARAAALRAQQELALAHPVARGGSAVATSNAQSARDAQLRNDARMAVLAALSPAHRAQVDASLGDILAGRIGTATAAQQLAAVLSPSEGNAIMDAFDRMQRKAGGSEGGRADLIGDASRYAVSVAFSDAQLAQLTAMPDAA